MNKKSIIMTLSVFLLFGCSQSGEDINEDTWGYEETISRSNSNAGISKISQDEYGFYFTAPSTTGAPVPVISYYSFQNHTSMLLNSNQKQCSWETMEQCTGYLGSYTDELCYYAEKLYVIYNRMNPDTEQLESILMQMNLDGTNRKEIMSIPHSTAKCFRFDKGFLYYIDSKGILKKVDMKNWEEQPFFELEQNKDLDAFKLKDNIVYFKYFDNSQQYCYDITKHEVYQLDHSVLSISDYGTISSSLENDHYVISLTKQDHTKKISDQVGLVSTTDDYFLIDTTHYEEGEQATLMLFDWNGTLLDSKQVNYQDEHDKYLSFQYTLAKDGYYTYVKDHQNQPILVRFPIGDGHLLDYIVIDHKGV